MVKFRVIKGRKENRHPQAERVRLFSAWSVVDNFLGHDKVKLNWIRMDRKSPVAGFETLIEGYEQTDSRMRCYFEEYVNELLTENEIELLRGTVLASLGRPIEIVEESVPISSMFMPMPFRALKPGENRGFFKLVGDPKSELSFNFRGYYDLTKSPSSIIIPAAALENGSHFLENALRKLGINAGEQSIGDAVKKVYDETGLFVEKGKNREERLLEQSVCLKPGVN